MLLLEVYIAQKMAFFFFFVLKWTHFLMKKKMWKILCFNYFPFYDECYTSLCLVWDEFIALLLSNKIANWIAVSTYFNVQLPTHYATPQSVWSYVRLRNVGEIHSPYRTSAYTAGAPSKYKLYKISQFLHMGIEFPYQLLSACGIMCFDLVHSFFCFHFSSCISELACDFNIVVDKIKRGFGERPWCR